MTVPSDPDAGSLESTLFSSAPEEQAWKKAGLEPRMQQALVGGEGWLCPCSFLNLWEACSSGTASFDPSLLAPGPEFWVFMSWGSP